MAPSSSIERELKVSVTNVAAVVGAIETNGAVLELSRHWERNWVLDRSGELLRSGSLLRVRDRWCEAGRPLGAVVTVKRPVESAAADAGIKERHEHEVDVAEAVVALRQLSQLDYRIARRYHKVRTAWVLDGHEIALDETPIGPWVEVEGPEPGAVARRLGLPERGDLRNYLSIYAAERSRRPELPEDMIFFDGAMADTAPPGFEAVRLPAMGGVRAGGTRGTDRTEETRSTATEGADSGVAGLVSLLGARD